VIGVLTETSVVASCSRNKGGCTGGRDGRGPCTDTVETSGVTEATVSGGVVTLGVTDSISGGTEAGDVTFILYTSVVVGAVARVTRLGVGTAFSSATIYVTGRTGLYGVDDEGRVVGVRRTVRYGVPRVSPDKNPLWLARKSDISSIAEFGPGITARGSSRSDTAHRTDRAGRFCDENDE